MFLNTRYMTVRILIPLTHFPLDKMATISKMTHLNAISWLKILFLILKGPIDNKLALVQVMAWNQTGNTPLPKPMLTQFTDVVYAGLGGD